MSDSSQLKASLQDAMKAAMRAKDKERLGTIRLVLAACKQVEVDERITLDDGRILQILNKMLKQRKDAIEQFRQAERHELADKEEAEIAIIQSFMPEAMSEHEIVALIEQVISELGAQSIKEMGQVMNLMRQKAEGRADMSRVSELVKKRLTEIT